MKLVVDQNTIANKHIAGIATKTLADLRFVGSKLSKTEKSLTLYRLLNWRNRDVMAGGEPRDRRHHLIILFNESQGTPQPDCSGMQVNQRHVATNEEVSAAASF